MGKSMVLPNNSTWGNEMNAWWKKQQAKVQGEQKHAIGVNHDVTAMDKQPVIYPDTPVNLPVDAIFTSAIPDTGRRFQSFLKIYRAQNKAGQAKPITVKKQGDIFILIDGGRRLAAARVLKLPTIMAIVKEGC